jgi:hypothetical protein
VEPIDPSLTKAADPCLSAHHQPHVSMFAKFNIRSQHGTTPPAHCNARSRACFSPPTTPFASVTASYPFYICRPRGTRWRVEAEVYGTTIYRTTLISCKPSRGPARNDDADGQHGRPSRRQHGRPSKEAISICMAMLMSCQRSRGPVDRGCRLLDGLPRLDRIDDVCLNGVMLYELRVEGLGFRYRGIVSCTWSIRESRDSSQRLLSASQSIQVSFTLVSVLS